MTSGPTQRRRLSPERQALLERQLADVARQVRRIPALPAGTPRPLSFAQHRLWLADQLDTGGPQFNRPTASRLIGALDVDALRMALTTITARHEILRTRIIPGSDGLPAGTVVEPYPIDLTLVDLTGLPAAATRLIETVAAEPFDLGVEPPLRARLIRLAPADHVLALVMHHVAADQASVDILQRELWTLYAGQQLAPLPIQYADYAGWQRDQLSGDALRGHLDFWRGQLADLPTVDLRADRSTPHTTGSVHHFDLPAAAGLRTLTRRAGASMFMTLLAGFQTILALHSGQDDFAVGTPIAGRAHPDTQDIIGLFVNTLLLRADLSGDPSFAELLQRVRRGALDAYAHQELPFEQLVDDLQPDRDRGRHALSQVMFNFVTAGSAGAPAPAGLEICGFPVNHPAAPVDLTLNITEQDDLLRGSLRYRTGLFTDAWVNSFADELVTLFDAVAANPDLRISEIPLRATVGADRPEQPEQPVPAGRVPDWISAQARETPDAMALDDLTYGQLEKRANQLAQHLRALGVGPESVVGLFMDRGPSLVIALLATWKAGAAYLPISPTTPLARVDFFLADTAPSVLITTPDLVDRLPDRPIPLVFPDDPGVPTALTEPPDVLVHPDSAAYLIHTSGSTGVPKAVTVTHRGLANYVHQVNQRLNLRHPATYGVPQPPSVDIGNTLLFTALAHGSTVHLTDPGEPVDYLKLTPSHVAALLAGGTSWLPRHGLILGGEAVPAGLLSRLTGTTVHNHYGPTETTVGVTTHAASGATLPIGTALPNVACHVLDRFLRPVPPGVPGELYVGGCQLARGYHDRAALTAERFVAGPAGSRLYRTGDLVRRAVDGTLEFLGRLDGQLKIRGFRVEPGEIEQLLTQHVGVSEAAVSVDGQQRLVAYVVGSPADLRDHLARQLPEHMIPATFVALDTLPRTAGGKIDRLALPTPTLSVSATMDAAPTNEPERVLVRIWREVLNVDRVGVHDDFFELGGHSLVAVQVVARAAAAGLRVTPAQIFDHPTIAELAAVAQPVEAAPADQERIAGPVGLLPAHRQWATLRSPHPEHFNQASWFRSATRLDVDLLRQAAAAVADHHDVLRVRASGYPDELRLEIVADSPPPVTRHEDSQDLARVARDAQAALDPEHGPIWRIELVGSRVLVVAHHIAVDTMSWRILRDDLTRAYAQITAGQDVDLGRKTSSVAQWAEHLGALPVGPTTAADLPVGHHTGPATHRHVGSHHISFGQTITEMLVRKAPAAYRTRVDDLLLAALTLAVHRWTGVDTVSVDVEGHGRADTDPFDLSRTVGWFTTYTAFSLPYADSLPHLIKSVKERTPVTGTRPAVLLNYHGQSGGAAEDALLVPVAGPTDPSVHPDTPLSHLVTVVGLISDGCLRLEISFPRTRFPSSTIQSFADQLENALVEVVEHAANTTPGQATPSDFPLARLRQPDVDHLVETTPFRIEDAYPLSPMQHGMLFHTLLSPDAGAYFEHTILTFDGTLDADLLRTAAQRLTDRHPVLRTAIRHHDQREPLQLVGHGTAVDWTVLDRPQTGLDAFLAADRARGFDLGTPPLMRFTLLRHRHDRHSLVIAEHHVLLDGWSLPLFLHDLTETYASLVERRSATLPTRRPYRDYIGWLAAHDSTDRRDFWRKQLAGFTHPTSLATDPPRRETGHTTYHWQLSDDATARLNELGRAHHLTLNTILRATVALLVAEHTGRDDVCYGATVAGRPDTMPGAEHMLGLFINTLPIRVRVRPELTLLGFLRTLQNQQLEQQPYEHTPLTEIHRESALPAGTALFDTILLFQNYPTTASIRPDTEPDRPLRICDVDAIDYNHYPLTLLVSPSSALGLLLSYDKSRMSAGNVHLLARHLTALLETIAADPRQRIGEISALTTAEWADIATWSTSPAANTPTGYLPDWIMSTARKNPGATAVVADGDEVTYAELDDGSNRLARHLVALGVRPESTVAVLLQRGADLVCAAVAVWKAGAAYLPIDSDTPLARVDRYLSGAGVAVVLTTSDLLDQLPARPLSLVSLDELVLEGPPAPPPDVSLHDETAAYVIYTSGSTGEPKAVTATHGALRCLAYAQRQLFDISPDDRVLLFASAGFDASISEIATTLTAGAALVVADTQDRLAPTGLITEQTVTVATLPPTMLASLDPSQLPALRTVISAGEQLPADVADRWDSGRRLINAYGPTETTVCATATTATTNDPRPPIGRPLPGLSAYVLDGRLRPVPIGVAGELHVAGPQLARGYQTPSLTAERFVANPLTDNGSRIYRTGDRVRWRVDGQLEFLGRTDDQLKIRGHRVEPAEVQASLRTHPQLENATVVGTADGRLIGYVVPRPGHAPTVSELRTHLRADLPDYLIPAAFVTLARLPLTASGKVDRTELPAPGTGRPHLAAEYRPPRTPTEEALADIWLDVLGLDRVGVDDNFFELDNHSLLATQVIVRVQTLLGVALPVAAIFDHPTIAGLAALINAASQRDPLPPITRADREQALGLSYGQQRLWFLDQLHPGDRGYHVPTAIRLDGDLNVPALRQALNDIVARHEILRTTIETEDGVPYQRVLPAGAVELPVTDLSDLPEQAALAQARQLVNAAAAARFDLSLDPPLRSALIRLSEQAHVLVLVLHHIASDQWSALVFHRELSALYAAFQRGESSPLPPLPIQYADFASWQRDRAVAGQLAYWRDQLADLPPLNLPTDRPRPTVRDAAAGSITFRVDASTTDLLHVVSRQAGTSMFMTLLAALQVVLSRYSGQNDVAIGTPIAGRSHQDTEKLIGFFVNNLVMRTDLSGDPTFTELLARVRATALDAYAHQDLPFEHLVEELQPERSRAHHPLFQVLFTHMAVTGPELTGLSGVEECGFAVTETATPFDLSFSTTESRGELFGSLAYSVRLFDAATVQRLVEHFGLLLARLAANPQRRLSEISLLGAEEQARLAENASGARYPVGDAATQDLISERALATPDAIAVMAGNESITYADLDRQSNHLARALVSLGVRTDMPVGLCLPRGVDSVVAVVSIWKAGGTCLPLDPSHPVERLRFMMTDSAATVLISDYNPAPDLAITVVAPDGNSADTAPPVASHPDLGAYLIYTSGSTGLPKAVLNHHRGLTSRLAWKISAQRYTAGDRVLHRTPLTFDVSFWEIGTALAAGATLVVAPAEFERDPAAMARLVATAAVTAAEFVPSLFAAFLDAVVPDLCRSLRVVTCAGETLPAGTVHRAYELLGPDFQLHNLYGPAETSVGATAAPCRRDFPGRPAIGTPLDNTTCHLLDAALRPVPIGLPGELFIGGLGVARGYLGRGSLTAERFVADPFDVNGSRLYRTGDRARWRADGQLEFLGRMDDQVKVRGVRVEPGEIESTLLTHSAVRAAAVVERDDRLVGYVVVDQPADLRAFLRERLPAPMVPAAFVTVAELPLTASGKVDRRALPAPPTDRPLLRTEFVEPTTTVESVLAEIWQDILGLDRVGVDDDFFDLGGHSLLAIRIVAQCRRRFGVDLPVAALFDTPTLGGLAARITAAGLAAPYRTIPVADHDLPMPLSFAQQRLWFLHQLEPDSTEYVLPAALEVSGPLSVDALRRALDALVARHEILRTVIHVSDGVPHQIVRAAAPIDLPVIDVSQLPPGDARQEAARLVDAAARIPFALAEEPPLRAQLIRLAEDGHVLLLVLHHIAADEWSIGILNRELSAFYREFSSGVPSDLPPLPIQYVDFASWQRATLTGGPLRGELDYWRERLAGLPELDLPTDRPRPPVRTPAGAVCSFALPQDISDGLHLLSRRAGTSMFMTTLAAFQLLLSRYCGQDDVVVGTPVAGRAHPDTEALIGFFVNTLVIRTDLSGNPSFADILRRVRTTALDAYAHQDLPFENLVEELQPERSRSRHPLFQVMFTYATMAGQTTFADTETCGFPVSHTTTPFDLSLSLVERNGSLAGSIEYSTDLFDAATIQRIARHFQHLIGRLVAAPQSPAAEISLLPREELRQLDECSRGATAPPVPSLLVHEVIFRHAVTTPDKIAVTNGQQNITYGQLKARAERVAAGLQNRGVGTEVVVGLLMERGVDVVVAMLGVLTAGGVYQPLDPATPAERLDYLVADSRAHIVLTKLDDLPANDVLASAALHPDNGAYLIYTSGSTGLPKGSIGTHRNLVQLANGWTHTHGLPADDVLLTTANITFDAFTGDLVRALLAGATLHIGPDRRQLDPAYFAELLAAHRITALETTPQQLAGFRPYLPADHQLRTVIVTADTWYGHDHRATRHHMPGTKLLTSYGLTETSVDTTTCDTTQSAPYPQQTLSVGRPLPHQATYILDSRLNPVPIGVPGEIHIAGAALTRGYHHRPALTAERFVPNPVAADGSRLYRTGDKARWLADGTIHFLGRTDHQLNLHGHRIEPTEVEQALTTHPQITAAAVTTYAIDDIAHLIAYITTHNHISLTVTDIRDHLRLVLPDHEIPHYYVRLQTLPLTTTGKTNRRALPAPSGLRPALDIGYTGPTSPAELAISDIWREVLALDQIGVRDDFFELGGHSLQATQVVARIRALFDIDLPVAALFESATVSALAAAVDAASRTRPLSPIRPVDRDQALPLSFAQQRLWFLHQLEPDSAEYHVTTAIQLTGDLSTYALTAALHDIVARHEILRTTIATTGGVAHQMIHPPRVDLPITDLSGLPPADRRAAAARLVDAAATTAFDLSSTPPLRARLLRLAGREHVLVVTLHHIAADEWSTGILNRELSVLYPAFAAGEPSPLPPLAVQYADFAAWQRESFTAQVSRDQLGYWQRKLSGLTTLALPTDHPRPPVHDPAGAVCHFIVPAEVTESLRAVSRRAGTSMFMTALAAFQVLLSRYCGQDDIAVGTPIAGRTHPDTEGLIGFFVNTLVLRADMSGNPTFIDLLAQVRNTALEAYAHQDLPFEQLVNDLRPDRDRARHPLFQVMFTYATVTGQAGLSGLETCGFPVTYTATPFELSLNLAEAADGLRGTTEYATSLFDATTIHRLATHFGVLVETLAATPDQPISEISLLSQDELREINRWSVGASGPPVPFLLAHEAIFRYASDKVAVTDQNGALTYEQLRERALQVAAALQARGVGPETVVGLLVPRGVDMIVAMLGVLAAGGIYLPLDPTSPQRRREYLIGDSKALLVLDNIDDLAAGGTLRQVDLCPSNGAYLIYTSGSTGMPKASLGTHRNLVQLAHGWANTHGLPTDDIILTTANTTFDAFTGDLVRALLSGATLHIGPDRRDIDPAELAALIIEQHVTALETTPQQLAAVRPYLPDDHRLRSLIVTADTWYGHDHRATREQLPGTRLFTSYGLSETSVDTTTYDATDLWSHPRQTVPVGRPLPHQVAYILDPRLNPAPVGVPGEIHIAGSALTRGYHRRPALTAERFVPDPFAADGSRLYRTGDKARWLTDGTIEFLGRTDHQINLHGHRIEPTEVEQALTTHPNISAAAVAAHGAGLVAYVVTVDAVPPATDIRDHLKNLLPGPFIPHHYVPLDALPTTTTGKIDRHALLAPTFSQPEANYLPPRTRAEQQLVEIWQDVLDRAGVGVRDDFFELGGDSILSLQVIARARTAGWRITPAQLFDHPTIADLATIATPIAGQVAPTTRPGPLQPLPIHRWWAAQQLEDPAHFNQARWFRSSTPLRADLLQEAANAVGRTHDALRLRVSGYPNDLHVTVADSPIGPVVAHPLEDADLAGIAEQANAALDLENGPIWRLELVGDSMLLVVIHHLAVDTLSWQILREDLTNAYEQLAASREVHLASPSTAVGVWAEQLGKLAEDPQILAELPYWRELAAAQPLAVDHAGPPPRECDARAHRISLSTAATEALVQHAASAYRSRVNDLLMAGLTRALRDWSGASKTVVDLEMHGRAETDPFDLSRTVGWFASFTPVLLHHPDTDQLADLVAATKESLRAIPRHGLGHAVLSHTEQVSDLPTAQIAFTYHGQLAGPLDQPDAMPLLRQVHGPTGPESHPDTPLPHLLDFSAAISDGQLAIALTYPATHYEEATIRALADHVERALIELVEFATNAPAGAATPSDFPLLRLSQAQVDRLTAAVPFVIADAYPLSPMQQGMLFHTLLEPGSGVYFEHTVLSLDGPVDANVLHDAFQLLVDRHPVLRTAIRHRDLEEPLQLVARQVTLPYTVQDWTATPAGEHDGKLAEFLAADRDRGLDLTQPPLLRLTLVKHATDRHTLVMAEHHLLIDGWSLPLLLDELETSYRALNRGQQPTLPTRKPFRDYLGWLADQDAHAGADFWRDQLAGFTTPTPLAATLPQTGPATHHWQLSADTSKRIEKLARSQRVTVSTVLRAALSILIARYTGQDDVCFGATVAGRPDSLAGAEDMLGLFINTIPVRVTATPNLELADFLQTLQTQQIAQQAHQHTPLTTIHDLSPLPPHTALFDTLLVVHNYPTNPPAEAGGQGGGLGVCAISGEPADHYPLTVIVDPGPQLHLAFSYHRAGFSADTIRQLAGHLTRLLENLPTSTDLELGDLSLLPPAEHTRVIADSSGPAADRPAGFVPAWIAQQALENPQAVAVADDRQQLTYAELEEKAGNLAYELSALGAGPETVVALILDSGPDIAAALLAAWKCGASYLPLDPDAPLTRTELCLDDSAASVIVTTSELMDQIPAATVPLVLLDGPLATQTPAQRPIHPDSVAYLIYTSGSTGLPKAVAVTHGGLASYVQHARQRLQLDAPGEYAIAQSLTVDFGHTLLFCALASGGTARIVRPDRLPAADYVKLTPSHLAAFLSADSPPLPRRALIIGGEPTPPDLAQRIAAMARAAGIDLHNHYGPTETTVGVTTQPGDVLAIGTPLPNVACYVLDEWLRLVPADVPGELYVAGVQLARGYHRQPASTAERFVANPFADNGSRLYRTGDRVRRRTDGALEHLGRIDRQVKIRGYRVEPAEIERVLVTHPRVRTAVIIATEDLVAYVVPTDPDEPPTGADLCGHLAASLPDHMVPRAFTVIDEIPLTASGKLDRRRLPAPGIAAADYTPPETPTERELAAIWRDILDVDRISAGDDFFDLGGHSLLAIQLVSRIGTTFTVDLAITDIFDAPVLRALAIAVDTARWLRDGGAGPADGYEEVEL